MKKLEYTVRFVTPAFLGNAFQQGQWRTPPFKALLRQWWRVVYVARHNFQVDVSNMRRAEGMLFGNAWLSHTRGRNTVQDHCRSLVQIRLSDWKAGGLRSWNGLEGKAIDHPEIQRTHYKVGPHAYLAYGPLDGRGGTQLTREPAISPGEETNLSLRVPKEHVDEIRDALAIINVYGAIGGRCRNGWGAFTLTPQDETPEFSTDLAQFFRPWSEALKLDWPHALGYDDNRRPLVWITSPYPNWRQVMRELAVIKVGFRTQFVFTTGQSNTPEERHWLAYPVTRHSVTSWVKDARMPNTLRFTVRPVKKDKLQGVIFHVPCKPPENFHPDISVLEKVWETTYRLLDEMTKKPEKRSYGMIVDPARRGELKSHLDEITIHRSEGGCP